MNHQILFGLSKKEKIKENALNKISKHMPQDKH